MFYAILRDLVLPLSSLTIAVVSVVIAVGALRSQRKHNQNSILPIVQIDVADHNPGYSHLPRHGKNFYIKITNKGTGPAIIDQAELLPSKKKHPIHLLYNEKFLNEGGMSPLTYTSELENMVLLPGEYFFLIKAEDPSESQLNIIRKVLMGETLHLYYFDVYNREFETSYSLDLFGKHFLSAENTTAPLP